MLKRTPSLTEQAKSYIKDRIINDEFEAGRIPSETELAHELGVSRTTIRDALSRLELEGVIYRKQGAGTFVNEAGLQIKTRLEEIWGYEAMLEAHGYTPSTQIIKVQEQPAQAELATELGLDPTDKVLVIQKLFLADKEPVILTCNSIPIRLIQRPYTDTAFHLPMFEFLPKFCQEHLAYYLSEIIPWIAPPWVAALLKLPETPTALLSFEELGYNQDNNPIVKAQSYFRDDLLRLRLIRRRS